MHRGFNGVPDLNEPMDAQGGEKIEAMVQLFGILLEDATERGQLSDNFYFLSDSVLSKFKLFQGFEPLHPFAGFRLEQADSIWNQTPQNLLRAILLANLNS